MSNRVNNGITSDKQIFYFRCSVMQESPMWRTSSPDLMVLGGVTQAPPPPKAVTPLKMVDRRLSLPESAMISPDSTDDEGGRGPRIKPFPSLLESQV